MSSLRRPSAIAVSEPDLRNKAMSVTPPVSHVEIWPYVASAAAGFESQASTAVRMLLSSIASAPRGLLKARAMPIKVTFIMLQLRAAYAPAHKQKAEAC